VPYWYSIHNAVLQLMLRQHNLTAVLRGDARRANREVKLVVMAPADMPPALANNAIAGYIVAEPFNAAAEVNRVGQIHRFTGDVWQNHACCVVIMHEDDVTNRPRWAQAVVTAVAKAQVYARDHRAEAARVLSREGGDYLPQPLPVIERAMTHYEQATYGPSGAIRHPEWGSSRIDFQPFPYPTYTEALVKLLKETAVEGDDAFLRALDPARAHAALVEDRFARTAIQAVGGAGRFGIGADLSREERITV
jgi:NitT/TauT family transport system substrate-binding protein